MRSPHAHSSLLLLAGALLAACSGGIDAPEESAGGAGNLLSPPPQEPPAAKAVELPPLFPDEAGPASPPPDLADEVARRDPARDGWTSEVLHNHAKHALHDFLDALVAARNDALEEEFWQHWLAPDFQAPDLRPERLQEVFADRGLVVRRAPPEALGSPPPPGGPPALFQDLVAPLRDCQHAHAESKIVDVRLEDGEVFRTRVFLQFLGLADGTPRQQTMECWIIWRHGEGEHVLLRGIEPTFYEEVRAPAPLFVEITGRVFGDNAFFRRDFLRGVNEYFRHMDRLEDDFFMGWQGLAVADVDGDGLEDVYVAQQSGLPNRLFRHLPDGRAVDLAPEAGVDFLDHTRGVLLLDLDNDGHRDLALTIGQNILLAFNDGQGRFRDLVGLEDPEPDQIHSLCAADPDGDGDLDIYACRYNRNSTIEAQPVPYYDAENGARNLYWRNEGNRRFVNATAEVGFDQGNHRFSLSGLWEDMDGDGDLDLFVANDFGRNHLWRNDGGGKHFTDVAPEVGCDGVAASMGVAAADYDLDGDVDLYISNMFSSAGLRITSQRDLFQGGRHQEVVPLFRRHARGNTLYRNRGDGTFEDVTEEAGVALGRWAWGARFVDFNNDSLADIYVPNGFITNQDPGDL